MNRKVGYARVSTVDQHPELQIDALKAAGCEQIFTDKGVSGRKFDRPGLEKALTTVEEGDTLIVWKLDRLGRSVQDLAKIAKQLEERNANLIVITQAVDTTTSTGRLVYHMLAAVAQFESDLISERVKAGMAAAKKEGKLVGRKRALSSSQFDLLLRMVEEGTSISSACRQFNISRDTYYETLKRRQAEEIKKKMKQDN
jgi:DNA invertase Pin-like site-specific DNA recombinase